MPANNKTPKRNKGLHPLNLHRDGYDFDGLIKACPELSRFIINNPYGNMSIDYSNAKAVKALNSALLTKDYGIRGWDIPEGFLCPPIPGRADYLHYIADLLHSEKCNAEPKNSDAIKLLDIGTGANGIYALLACKLYSWTAVASDIDPQAIANVAAIVDKNPALKNALNLRLQPEKSKIFEGIIQAGEHFDVSVCNPPFHASLEEALKGNDKKRRNLSRNSERPINDNHTTALDTHAQGKPAPATALNFGGQKAELWCKGGEQRFLRTMMKESRLFATQCTWFTTLISKSENVKPAKKLLRKLEAHKIKEIEMRQGNKITRVVAWTFLS